MPRLDRMRAKHLLGSLSFRIASLRSFLSREIRKEEEEGGGTRNSRGEIFFFFSKIENRTTGWQKIEKRDAGRNCRP